MHTAVSTLLQDLRYAVGQSRRAPGFALGVVLIGVQPELSSLRCRDVSRSTVEMQLLQERVRALSGVDPATETTVAPKGGFSSISAVGVGEGARGVSPQTITVSSLAAALLPARRAAALEFTRALRTE